MMVFDSAVADTGIFKIQDPFKQLGAFYLDRVNFKLIFSKTTKGLDAESVGLNS